MGYLDFFICYLSLINATGFLLMLIDKKKARNRKRADHKPVPGYFFVYETLSSCTALCYNKPNEYEMRVRGTGRFGKRILWMLS